MAIVHLPWWYLLFAALKMWEWRWLFLEYQYTVPPVECTGVGFRPLVTILIVLSGTSQNSSGLVPAQDVPFALILWYVAKTFIHRRNSTNS